MTNHCILIWAEANCAQWMSNWMCWDNSECHRVSCSGNTCKKHKVFEPLWNETTNIFFSNHGRYDSLFRLATFPIRWTDFVYDGNKFRKFPVDIIFYVLDVSFKTFSQNDKLNIFLRRRIRNMNLMEITSNKGFQRFLISFEPYYIPMFWKNSLRVNAWLFC
jgi:hypothetical protein